MKKALIIYHTQKGKTRKYGENIKEALEKTGFKSDILSVYKCNPDQVSDYDYIFLGCWTSGLMIILQHPEKIWINFAKKLPDLVNKKIVLFTTYKIATGSMFGRMRKFLNNANIIFIMKSKTGFLTDNDKLNLQNL